MKPRQRSRFDLGAFRRYIPRTVSRLLRGFGRTPVMAITVVVVTFAWATACGDGDLIDPWSQSPTAVGTIPAQSATTGDVLEVDAGYFFGDPGGDIWTYSVVSSNPGVAVGQVSRGVVRVEGLQGGTATLTVTATGAGGLSAEQGFTVAFQNQPPDCSMAAMTLEVGDSDTRSCTGGTGILFHSVESYNASIVDVETSNGVHVSVEGKTPGSTTVWGEVLDGTGLAVPFSFGVTVGESIQCGSASVTLFVGEPTTVNTSDVCTGSPPFTPASVTVGPYSTPGFFTANVPVSNPFNSDSLTINVTVVARPASPDCSTLQDMTLYVGETGTTSCANAESHTVTGNSNPTVASASGGSVVTVSALQVGTATISVTGITPNADPSTSTGSFTVTVVARPPSPDCSTLQDMTLYVGETGTTSCANAESHTVTGNSNPTVASASGGSVVTVSALQVGTATISVEGTTPNALPDKSTGSFNVTVIARPPSPDCSTLQDMTLYVGETGTTSCANAESHTVTGNSNPTVASASGGSVVTVSALKVGTTTISVTGTTQGALPPTSTGSFTVTVIARPPSPDCSTLQNMTLYVGQTGTTSCANADSHAVTGNSNPAVASASGGSLVTVSAQQVGQTTISVTGTTPNALPDKSTGSFNVTVIARPPSPDCSTLQDMTLYVGETGTTSCANAESHTVTGNSNPTVASASGGSVVTVSAQQVGTTTISVTGTTQDARPSSRTGSFYVTVYPQPTPPSKPYNFTATAGDGRVTLSASASANGSPITKWQYRQATTASGLSSASWNDINQTGGSLSYTVDGLTNGTTYHFRVRARNNQGAGPESDSRSATPRGVPGKPTNFTATAGDGRVTLSASASANGSPITKWEYKRATSASGLSSASWNDISQTGGSLSYPVPNLVNGTTYHFRVRARNNQGAGPESDSRSATPRGVPGKPTNFTATAGDGRVTLSASASANGSPITKWEYKRATSASGLSSASWNDINQTGGSLSYPVTGLTNGTTYHFQVRAVNAVGAGPTSDPASATPAAVPGKPTNFTATAGDGQVTLSASASANGSPITKWQYQQATSASGLGSAPWNDISQTGGTLGHTVDGLTNGTTYHFQVRAVNAVGAGPASDSESATPWSEPIVDPNFTATAGDGQVTLSAIASANGSPITKWQYQQATTASGLSSASWNDINQTGGSLSYTVDGLTNGTTYHFRVRALNAVGAGPASNPASATPAGVPGEPTNFAATAGDGQVTLSASTSANGSPITKWQYQQATSASSLGSAPWNDISQTGGTLGHTVDGLTNGTTYHFQVRAVNAVGDGPASDPASAMPVAVPGPVRDLSADPGDGHVVLTWNAPSTGGPPSSYVVRHRSGSGAYGAWTDVGLATSQMVTGLTNGTAHTFQVRARNASGAGASDSVTATPAAVPDPPTGLSGSPGDGRVDLTWGAPSTGGSPTSYEVRHRSGSGAYGSWTDVGGATSHGVTGLTNGTEYTFQVRARNASGAGAPDSVTATPAAVPDPPTGLSGSPGDGRVDLTWGAPSTGGSPTSYEVRHRSGSGAYGSWTDVGGATSHGVTGLTNGTEYTFQVRARNASGAGAPDSVTATPVAVPDPPTGLSGSPGDGRVDLTWGAPSTGGSPTSYEVRHRSDSGAYGSWTDVGGATSHGVTGLTNGTAYTFQVRARNASGAGAPDSVTATPNVQPDLGPDTLSNRTYTKDQDIATLTLPAATGGDAPLTYALADSAGNLPAGLTFDAGTRQLSGKPTAVQAATEYAYTVTDVDGDADSLTFMIAVAEEPNQPPVPVGTIPPDTVDAGDTLTLNVAPYFSDPDGDELTYSATNSDSTVLTVSVTDSALTVVGVAAGADTVTVTATDPGGLSAEQRFEVTVPNQPPDTVGAIPPDTVTVGGTLTVNLAAYFSDPDGDALTYSATNADATVLTVTVADSVLTVLGVAAGADTVTVTATDPDGLSAEQRFEVVAVAVIPPPPNQPPVPVGTIPADTVGVGDMLTVNVAPYFSDPDGDTLTYSATSSDATVLTVTVADSVLTVVGLADGVGVVTVTAKDGPHTSAPQVFEVTVGVGLALPVVSLSVVSGSVAEGDTARVAVVASPAPSAELRVSYQLRADTVAGTADADSLDVAEWSGEVVFGAGTVTAFAEIAVVDDAVAEPTREVFVVELTAPAPGAGYRLGGATSGAVTILEGVCDRTPVVRDGIVWEASASDCAAVDDAILGGIDDLNLDDKAISALRAGDFAGLAGLEDLRLRQNALDSLPEAVFAGLGNLKRLRLQNNSLDALPAGVFGGLSNLELLRLDQNSLDLLPADVFDGLANLEQLRLNNNSLDVLPVGVFDGLTNLERLRLQNNSLDSLPDGAFVGLGNLDELRLNNNGGNDPFGLAVELERLDAVAGSASCAGGVDGVRVRATLRHGAPARLGVPVSANGATLSADTLVFAAGSSASDTVTACGSGRASMRFGPAPALPSGFLGLEVVPGDSLVLTANRAPELDAPIPDTVVAGGGATVTVDAAGHFSDPDGDALTYAATSSNAQVATVSVAGSVVTVTVVGSGLTEVEVVASDAHESARDTFAVRVVPSVSFASDTASAPEGATLQLGLVVSPAPASAFQLYYAVGADADPETADADAADHGVTGVDSVLVAAGATGAGIGIAIADDATIEPTRELFVVTLGPPGPDTAYLPGPTATATGTILEGVCDRTPGVRDGIVAAATAADCAAVDDGALAGVGTLNLGNAGVSAPRTGDFSGLSALTALHLNQNGIDSLPADVFVGLDNLERLHLNRNNLASLPADVFDGLASLKRLHLNNNSLASLPTDAFDGLASLERLHLNNNSLASLPADAFDGLASLGRLHLNNNSLDSLPAGAFDGLASLWRLHLNNNSLDSLPDGVFVGLDGLTRLDLGNNDGNDPFKLAVELERAGGGSCAAGANGVRVRATLRLGAPTRLAMPVSADGATTLSADTLVFAAGASASDTVTACWSGSGGASVWFGPAPALPAGFAGLVVEPGDTLALARNRAPEVDAPIADTVVAGGDAVTVDASEHFSDPDGDPLAYAATSSDALVATVAVAGSVVTVTPVGSGETDVEVVASDGPLSVADTFSVRFVPTVSFASGAASAPEGATLQLELVVSPAPASPLQVRYSVGADADPATADADSADHGATGVDSVLVAAGATSAEVGLAIADDAAIEPTRERFVVTLLEASGADSAYLPGSTATATGTILEGVCDRTPGVRDGIVAATTAADCAAVDDAALAGLGVLNLDDAGVAAPRTGDFSGLPGLTELHLRQNGIDSLPADVFVGLDSLERLFLNGNDLDSLPADAFDGLANLRRLYLNGNDLASLPADLFDGLANLQWLFLNGNDLGSLPADAFDDLANLQRLSLNGNDLASLPADAFDGLTNLQRLFLQGNSLDSLPGGAFDDLASLQRLRLDNNDLDSLPDGVFVGLDGLTLLNLGGNNPGAPFGLAVELERLEGAAGSCAPGANGARVRATLRLGAPARLGVPVSADGATTLSADTLVFAAGASASDTVTACWSGSGIASVWFGPAPALPSGFTGLVVVPGDTLDLDPNRAPLVSLPIPDTLAGASDTVTVDATGHFTDPDGDPLTYAATSLDALVATVSVAGNVVTVAAIAAGETSVEVVASDSSLSARDTFAVRVAPSVSFESATASAAEGETLLLELDVPSSASAFHVYYSVDVDADPATADADSADHGRGAAERDSVLVAAGATSASIGIAIADDATIEAAREHFVVTLEAPAGSDPAYLPGPTARATARIREGVCDRTPEVRDGIVAAVAAADCAAVDEADLAGLAVLDLGDEDISALRGRDLMGLSGLDTLDLADNDLTSLPAGLFEGVGSLARLDLGNQGGDPNSSITLQIAFERTDGPMTGSAPATLRMTLAEGAPTALNTRIQIVTGSWTTASDVFFDAGSVHSASANVGSDGVGQTTVNPFFQGLAADTLTLPDFVGVAFKLPASITLF